MRRPIVNFFRIIVTLITICLLSGIIFIGFLSLCEYRPAGIEHPEIQVKKVKPLRNETELTFLTWNIGYAGLGKEMDFFYEGGSKVKPTTSQFKKYLDGIEKMMKANDTLDFIFIQEADQNSKRSFFINEEIRLSDILKEYNYAFAKNYDSRFVPVPLYDPMGKVISGIITFSRFLPYSAERIDFGTKFSWPERLVFLKRCFLVMRFHLDIGNDLVIINTHNSVFDEEGELRKKEMEKLNKFILSEYLKGNFVVAGGDWNQNPRGFRPEKINSGDVVKTVTPLIGPDFLHGWQFVFDASLPTNRDVDKKYQKGVTKTTIIDFFVVSPNIEVKFIKAVATGFENSDHQPVIMKIKLRY